MKKFTIVVLNPSSNVDQPEQRSVDILEAHDMDLEDGAYMFYLNDKLIACYPVSFTIIASIEDVNTDA